MTDKARELLERALEAFCSSLYGEFELKEEIRAYLAEPEQDEEPKTHEPWCAYLTQMLMSNPPQRSECNCKNTTAPRPEFVRLSEEEMKACEPQLGIVKTPDGAKVDGLWIYDFARAIEDALEEKNK